MSSERLELQPADNWHQLANRNGAYILTVSCQVEPIKGFALRVSRYWSSSCDGSILRTAAAKNSRLHEDMVNSRGSCFWGSVKVPFTNVGPGTSDWVAREARMPHLCGSPQCQRPQRHSQYHEITTPATTCLIHSICPKTTRDSQY